MSDSCLFDLPDELLIRCLAGAGGLGIGSAASACTRLEALSKRLKQLPIFSSALSTHASLQHAIRDAGQRALAGCFGAVDFALLFVANYGNTRGKKYPDPTDLGHAVEMLRDVLGQDVAIVGCACAGLMGVGPDSQPVEVDPAANHARGRAAAAARKKAGLPPLPTKGVSVLLGKLPPGCVARAFAQKTMEGPAPSPDDPDAPVDEWCFMDDVLALNSSQAATLAQHLNATSTTPAAAAAAHTTTHPPGSSHQASTGALTGAGGVNEGVDEQGTDIGASPQQQLAGCTAGVAALGADSGASPSTAAAPEGLLSVVAAAAAAAGAGADAAADAAPGQQGGVCGVELVPQLCLLLYDEELQSFGYTASPEMERALTYLAARGVAVVGGASSGAGDLFFSPGADAGRFQPEPTGSNKLVGLMLCTARAPTAAPATQPQSLTTPAAAAAAAAAAGLSHPMQHASSAPAGVVDSSSALQVAALASLGLGASAHAPLFSDLRAKLVSSQTLSVNHIAVQLEVEGCSFTVTEAAAAQPTQGAAEAAAAEAMSAEAEAAVTSAEPEAAAGAAAAAAAATSAATSSGPAAAAIAGASSSEGTIAAQDALTPARRSTRLAAAAAAAEPPAPASAAAAAGINIAAGQAAGASVDITPIHHLFAAVTAGAPTAMFEDDDEADDGQYLALWLCPQGHTPTHFTGEEEQVALVELLACDLDPKPLPLLPGDSSSSSSTDRAVYSVKISAAVHVSDYTALRGLFDRAPAGSRMCCQVVKNGGAACARTLQQSLSRLLPLVDFSAASTHPAGVSTPSAAVGCTDVAGPSGVQSVTPVGPGKGSPASSAMQECYDALAKAAFESGARSGLQALTATCCTGRGRELYAPADEDDPTWQHKSNEASIIDAVGCSRVPFVGAYVAGELGPEVRHMCTGWFKPGRGEVSAAEMQGFTTMVAAWGCPPGVA